MDRRRAAGALLALAACVACSTAAPTASNQTALELLEGPTEGCYYNFQHYGEGDRIMTNEPCLNCTCHNRMLMCYLRVCPFTKPIGQDCTIEKRADQCCPIVTCPDVPVDLLTSTSTSSPAEYGATGLGKVDKYGCSINGKYFSEGSKVPPSPNKPCEHCYCIRNMTTCVMQECTLHVDGCTPIYHKDVCCPVRYSCDHQEDDMLLLDDMTTTVRPTPGFLLTTTTIAPVTQMSQDCVHDDQIFADGALIKTEKACEHCYCMKGDIVCVVQECGTPMENEGKNCTSLPPRQGQCCPDTYICEGDEIISDVTTGVAFEDLTTLSPPRRVEGSGYRNEPDEPYTEISTFEGSGEEQATTLDTSDMFTSQKQTPQIVDDIFTMTEEPFRPSVSTVEPDKGQNTVPDDLAEITPELQKESKTTQGQDDTTATQASITENIKDSETDFKTTISDYHPPNEAESSISLDDELIMTTGSTHKIDQSTYKPEVEPEIEKDTTSIYESIPHETTSHTHIEPSSSEASTLYAQEDKYTTEQSAEISKINEKTKLTTTEIPMKDYEQSTKEKQETSTSVSYDKDEEENIPLSTTIKTEIQEITSINPIENEIDEDLPSPGRIPGEGDCLLNGITYQNNTSVPNINNCHSSCKCVSSIVKCDPIICSPPPEHMDNMHDCQPIYDTPDACCPTYVCHSRETIPPESHSQMSGTDSPKETESECHGDKCQPHETSQEPCNSENCEAQKTESSSDKSPSMQQPEDCVGTNCFSTDEGCVDGKCQQPTISEHICNNENGCQPSEAELCSGNNCESDVHVPKDEKPACKDAEGCKISETAEEPKPSCDVNECDTTITSEDKLETECTEENCRRKQQPQDEQSLPSECTDSNCKTPETGKDESNVLTTDTPIKDELPLEPTTEKIYYKDITKSPESEEPITEHRLQEITQTEELEKQETSELSTQRSNDVTDSKLDKHVTEVHESFTQSYATKLEDTVTETFKEPEPTDHHIFDTEPEEQVTESLEHITKNIPIVLSTETNVIQYEEHLTQSSIGDESSTAPKFTEPAKTFDISTEALDTDLHDIDRNKDVTVTIIDDLSTEKQEIITKTPDIHVTASKVTEPEKDMSEEELTSEQEEYTETPEKESTQKDEVKDGTEITKFEQITEPSITSLLDTSTEKRMDDTTKEDEGTNVAIIEATETPKPATADHVPAEEPIEPLTTTLEESVTNKMYGDSQTEQIITENPNVYTAKTPVETTKHDIFEEEEKEQTQTTIQGISNESQDTDIENTESSVQDQQENTPPPLVDYTSDTDKKGITKTPVETQEHVTSSISLDNYGTQPPVIEELPQTQENLSPEEVEVTSPQPSITESPTIVQDITSKESSTHYPEVTVTSAQDITSKSVDDTKISDQDFTEVSTSIPDVTFDKTTTQLASEVTNEINTVTSSDVKIEELTSKPETDSETATTISFTSDKDQEKSTVAEPIISNNEQTTLAPEVLSTKTDATSVENIEKQTSETRRVGSEITTTESLIQTGADSSDISDKVTLSPEPAIDQSEKTTEMSITDIKDHDDIHNTALISGAADKETGTTSIGENVTKEPSIITQPDAGETKKQSPGLLDTMSQEDHVTENIESNITEKSGEEIQTPTEYSISHETKSENMYTSVPEISLFTVPPSQDTETKYETQTEINTTPQKEKTHEIYHTESPMSLVTEAKEHLTSASSINPEENSSYIPLDITTQASIMYSPENEDTESHDVDVIKPHQSTTSNEILTPEKEDDSKTLPPVSSDDEKVPESVPTTATIEYTTAKFEDVHKEEITSPPIDVYIPLRDNTTSETFEQVIPTTERQEAGSELQSMENDVLQESTVKPIAEESQEYSTDKKQEVPTTSPETPASVATDIYKEEPELTEQPPQSSSTESKILETVPDDTSPGYGQEQEVATNDTLANTDEHTILPELVTTKPVGTSLDEQEKDTDEIQPSKQETSTSTYDERITSENVIYSEQPVSPDEEHHATIVQDKSTEKFQEVDIEKDFTTPAYERFTTIKESEVPEVHLSTLEILSTESSITGLHEEDHKETPEIEYFVTEKHDKQEELATTGLPEVTERKEESDKEHEISTILPLRENITEVESEAPADEQSTESGGLQTIGVTSHEDEDIISATENVEKHITELQGTSEKPLYTEQVESETELPIKDVTVKDETIDRTTDHVDLVQVPVETIPEKLFTEQAIRPESETETVPKETETELYVRLEHETETSIPKRTESTVMEDIESVPVKTEIPTSTTGASSIEMATDSSVQKEPQPSLPVETETEVSIPKETDASVPVETETEVSIPKETDASVPVKTEAGPSKPVDTETESPVNKATEVISPEVSKPSKVTEVVQKETETPEHDSEHTESTTYKQKDDNEPKVVTTFEPVDSSSETTPYLVELQEHTNKIDEDTSPAMPIDTTKTSELYQTERGDQSLDTVTDKDTEEFIHAEHTSEITNIDEDVKPTTESQEQPGDQSVLSTSPLEEIPEKTEQVTESISITSESPVPPLSDIPPAENIPTIFTEEQTPTPSSPSGHEKLTTAEFISETSTDTKYHTSVTEKSPDQEAPHDTAPEDEFIPTVAKSTTQSTAIESTTQFPTLHEKVTQPEDKPVESYLPTTSPDLPKPGASDIQPTDEIPSPDFPPSGTSGYGQEPDYVEEDQAFGPGTCRYGGKVYVSAQQIPRDDPCDFCFCFRSDIICLQQSCPPPIQGCHEEPIQGFCCPRYECPVSMATTLNVTTTTTTTTTTLPPHFLPHAYKGAAQRRGCQIKGHTYKVGDVVRASSGPCLHCTCGGDGQMKCDPKACTPEPMLRQMIAAAVSAKRRR